MITEKETIERAKDYSVEMNAENPSIERAFYHGAKWANEQNSIEIAELVEVVKSLKAGYEVLMQDVKTINKHFKPFPQEKAALSRADELIKKYGK